MKKLGLIGGTGPESTLVYYKELNTRLNKAAGGNAFPELPLALNKENCPVDCLDIMEIHIQKLVDLLK